MKPLNRFAQFVRRWPTRYGRVLGEYHALGGYPLLLADIARRGHLFSPMPIPRDAIHAGELIGRHNQALEIIELSGTNADSLRKLIESSQPAKPEE